jgi:hypothetical protein
MTTAQQLYELWADDSERHRRALGKLCPTAVVWEHDA